MIIHLPSRISISSGAVETSLWYIKYSLLGKNVYRKRMFYILDHPQNHEVLIEKFHGARAAEREERVREDDEKARRFSGDHMMMW